MNTSRKKHSARSRSCAPLPREAVGRGRGWGVARHILKQRFQRRHPPPPTPPRHAQGRVEGGECTVHRFATSLNNVIASAAKQSILSYFLGELWIASLRSQ